MTKSIVNAVVILITITISIRAGYGQAVQDVKAGIPVNYDESLSGTYTLPDPLVFPDGKKVKSASQWYKKRRPQIVSLFEEFEYGRIPAMPKNLSFDVFDKGTPALNGKAIRKQVTVYLTSDTSDHKMELLIYLPAEARGPVPVFFNVSFSPNVSVVDDPGIKAGFTWGETGKRYLLCGRANSDGWTPTCSFRRVSVLQQSITAKLSLILVTGLNTGSGDITLRKVRTILLPMNGVQFPPGRGD